MTPVGATLPYIGTPPVYLKSVLINDDEATPEASLENVTVAEGAGPMTLTLEIDRESEFDITYRTVPSQLTGTATLDDDYEVSFDSEDIAGVTIPAGELSATFDIPLIDDTLVEGNETVTINWNYKNDGSGAATPAMLTFIGTITDNDPAAQVMNVAVTVGDTELRLAWDAVDPGRRLQGAVEIGRRDVRQRSEATTARR